MSIQLTKRNAVLAVLALWAPVYLIGVGQQELKGEEGRRISPAITMLDGGSWIVPQVVGEPYYNKPPGINWLVAGSMALLHSRSEWAARLPSALAVLAVALVLVLGDSPILSLRARLLAALMYLTCIGTLEKGRLIEIEGVYMSLTALALAWWLGRYFRQPRGLLTWVVPSLFIAYGSLVKGPFLAAGFYPALLCVLCYRRKVKDFFCPASLLGMALILGLNLGWVFLAMRETNALAMAHTWSGQLGTRLAPHQFHPLKWAEEIAQSPVFLLPYLLLLPLAWMRRFVQNVPAENLPTFKALRLGAVIGFALLMLMPGMESRYIMPAMPAFVILLAWVLESHQSEIVSDRIWRGILLAMFGVAAMAGIGALAITGISGIKAFVALAAVVVFVLAWRILRPQPSFPGFRLTAATAVLLGLCFMEFDAVGAPYLQSEHRRAAAAAIDEHVPPGEPVYIVRPNYRLSPSTPIRQPSPPIYAYVYYIRTPIRYVLEPADIDANVHYLLISKQQMEVPEMKARLAATGSQEIGDPRMAKDYLLLRLGKAGVRPQWP